jgi:hypothetical protein
MQKTKKSNARGFTKVDNEFLTISLELLTRNELMVFYSMLQKVNNKVGIKMRVVRGATRRVLESKLKLGSHAVVKGLKGLRELKLLFRDPNEPPGTYHVVVPELWVAMIGKDPELAQVVEERRRQKVFEAFRLRARFEKADCSCESRDETRKVIPLNRSIQSREGVQ